MVLSPCEHITSALQQLQTHTLSFTHTHAHTPYTPDTHHKNTHRHAPTDNRLSYN